jgi:DNA-binding response OmpR family regulator
MGSVRKRNRILLVDDEPDLTMTFKAILQIAGIVVDAYEDPLIAFPTSSQDAMIWLYLIVKYLK